MGDRERLHVSPSSFLPVSLSSSHRLVWDNPILWREIRTWAYGRKILIVRMAFLALFALAAGSLWQHGPQSRWRRPSPEGRSCLLPLLLVEPRAGERPGGDGA